MKTLDKIVAWAQVVLGIVHAAATFSLRPLGLGAVWFFSAGAAFIMAGLMNVNRTRHGDEFTRATSVVANLLAVAICIAVVWFARNRLAHNPQIIAATVLSVTELLFSLGRR